jgi:hypothetical protein
MLRVKNEWPFTCTPSIHLRGVDSNNLCIFTLLSENIGPGRRSARRGKSSSILNVTVGGLAAIHPGDYSQSPTVETADSSRRIREPPGDALEQWRSVVFRRLGQQSQRQSLTNEFKKMTVVYWISILAE